MSKHKQKFHHGDLVQIAKNLGESMSHFTADKHAIVMYSYADEYGGDNVDSYSLYVEGEGGSAWYHTPQLTLIKHNQLKLLKQWKKEADEEFEKQSSIDWIFEHGEELTKKGGDIPNASIIGLAKCLNITEDNLWGSHGEGLAFYFNSEMIFNTAKPFLEKQDKRGWLNYCKKKIKST